MSICYAKFCTMPNQNYIFRTTAIYILIYMYKYKHKYVCVALYKTYDINNIKPIYLTLFRPNHSNSLLSALNLFPS